MLSKYENGMAPCNVVVDEETMIDRITKLKAAYTTVTSVKPKFLYLGDFEYKQLRYEVLHRMTCGIYPLNMNDDNSMAFEGMFICRIMNTRSHINVG